MTNATQPSTSGKLISSEIRINATPEKVWKVFSDFGHYPAWNPFIKSLTGEVSVGKTITARIEPPGASAMTFKPKVLACDTNKELRWIGHLLIPGLFDGEHRFQLIDNGDGSTTFIQSERFKGILIPLFKKMLDVNTQNGFILMNQKVKELAEQN